MSPHRARRFVSVIVPHYDDLDNLRLCLALLERQSFPREDFEIVVADNRSPCGLAAVAAACGPRRDSGRSDAAGRGARAQRRPRRRPRGNLAFIDSDCRPAPDWLARGLDALRDGAVVAGKVEVVFADAARPTAAEAYEAVFAFDAPAYARKGFCLGCNMFARRADFFRVGLFRSGAPEDMDWSRRALALGLTLVYDEGVVVGHPARRDWPQLARKARRVVGELYRLRRDQGAGAGSGRPISPRSPPRPSSMLSSWPSPGRFRAGG